MAAHAADCPEKKNCQGQFRGDCKKNSSLQTPSQPQQQPPVPPAPEPDVTVKYGVMLGPPAANLPAGKEYDGVEAPAFETAKVEASDIAAFRRHLKTCSTLPAPVAPTDKVRIVLRVLLSRDGRLPTLVIS